MKLRKFLDLEESPDMRVFNASGGAASEGKETFPLEQHMPGDSPTHFLALQNGHVLDFSPISTF